jgi:hypothetical protein
MNRLQPTSLAISLFGATAAGVLALAMQLPARAACIPSTDPIQRQATNCSQFDTLSPSYAIVAFQDAGFLLSVNFRQIRFRAEGFDAGYPITLQNIAYSFNGGATWLTTGMSSSSYTITGNDEFDFGPDLLTTDQLGVNFSNFRLTYTIPAGTLAPLGGIIYARVAANGGPQGSQEQTRGSTLADPVPGPLPILGAGVAFGFSRKLRRRIRQAV